MSTRIEHFADGVTMHLGDAREVVPTLPVPGCIVSDPPYGMAFRSNYRKVKHAAIQNDGDESALVWACEIPVIHSRYIFCRWDNLTSVPKPKSMVTWVKNNWSMGDLEHEHGRQTEVALFYPGPQHRFPKGRPNDVIMAPRTGNEHHPSEKPVQLMMAVLEWTEGGGTGSVRRQRLDWRRSPAAWAPIRRHRTRSGALRHRLQASGEGSKSSRHVRCCTARRGNAGGIPVMSWFRYARHADVPALAETGLWAVIADLGPTHGAYSVLMQWCGEGEPSAPPHGCGVART